MAPENNNNTRKVSEKFVIEVFDKVKEVNDELADDVKELRTAVIGLGEAYNKRYEGQPRPIELHTLLDTWGKTFEDRHSTTKEKLLHLEVLIGDSHTKLQEHCDHAEPGIDSIEKAVDKDVWTTKLDKILKRVNTMIIVVAVAFSVITLAYLFVRSSVDVIVDKKIEKIEKQHQTEIQKQLEQIKRSLEEHMRKEK